MELFWKYISIYFFHLLATSSRFRPLQVESCDSNSRLEVDENVNGKLRFEKNS